MPYIDKKSRYQYDQVINAMPTIKTKGDLEYCVMRLFKIYMDNREFRYSTLHDAVYAVQHVADECRRRFLDQREDIARQKNGDVY